MPNERTIYYGNDQQPAVPPTPSSWTRENEHRELFDQYFNFTGGAILDFSGRKLLFQL